MKTSVQRELRVWVLWIWMVAGSFSISYKMWKWPKKLFFCLVDLRIPNAFTVHTSCGGHLMRSVPRTKCRESYWCYTGYKFLSLTSRCGWPPSKEVHHFWLDFFFNHGLTAPVGQGLLVIEDSWSHSDTPHLVGLLWTSDQPVAETSTWQHTTLTIDRHPYPWQDSNPQSKQVSGRRPTP